MQVETVELDQKLVVVIEIRRSKTAVCTSSGKYLRRRMGGQGQPVTEPMSPVEIASRNAVSSTQYDYTLAIMPGAKWEDLDPREFERFRDLVRRSNGDPSLARMENKELANILGAISGDTPEERITVAGLLLFGKEESLRRFIPNHEVAFQVLSGTEVEMNNFYRKPLLKAMEEMEQFFNARNREQEVMVGIFRWGIPDYSPKAFREAVANALIHRDYTKTGAVHIQWHSDRLEISNPGGFPEGVNVKNILVTPPRPRNRTLAEALMRAGLVERTGRGVDLIFREQLRSGRPAPSYERSSESTVILVIPGGKANLNFVTWLLGQEDRMQGVDELLVLNTLQVQRRVSITDLQLVLQKSSADTRAVLEKLVESGWIEARGERKGRVYMLSESLYRQFAGEEAYIRQSGLNFEQQRETVMRLTREKGKIANRDVARLCHLTTFQASRLLAKLVAEGVLERIGRKRAAYYIAKQKVP